MKPDLDAIAIALLSGICLKIIWDWMVSGREKKESPYVTGKTCEEIRAKCCIIPTKRELSNLAIRVMETEKRLEEGAQSFREVKADINKNSNWNWNSIADSCKI